MGLGLGVGFGVRVRVRDRVKVNNLDPIPNPNPTQVSRAEGGLQLLTAVIDGGQLTGARVVELLAELRQLEEREMAELLPMEEAIARNPTLNPTPTPEL